MAGKNHFDTANQLSEKFQFLEAAIHYCRAAEQEPDNLAYMQKLADFASLLNSLGYFESADMCLDCLIRHASAGVQLMLQESRLMPMNYDSRHNPQDIFDAHQNWGRMVEQKIKPAVHVPGPAVNRRLRIGYVSGDFFSHSLCLFIGPVLRGHDKSRVEVYCYSDVAKPDEITQKLKEYAEFWRDIAGLPNDQVFEMIRKDGIDILIDLAGHTANNRLLVFAQKPAPVQVTWLGYPNTTGLVSMDYRLTDHFSDPPGLTDQYYTERLVRLPKTFLCFNRVMPVPVGPPPCIQNKCITFGCFVANLQKIPEDSISLWARILLRVPNSRMLLKAKYLGNPVFQQRVAAVFLKYGVDAGRLIFHDFTESTEAHYQLLNQVDICLDPLRYNGTTVTCQTLWMGVPVVTLAGRMHVSRVGYSIMTNAGLPDLVGSSEDDYIRIAAGLAKDEKRLQIMRRNLRHQMLSSPLMKEKEFAADLETACFKLWKRYENQV